jgi:hypothetical protein
MVHCSEQCSKNYSVVSLCSDNGAMQKMLDR